MYEARIPDLTSGAAGRWGEQEKVAPTTLRNQVHGILHQGTKGTLQRTEISYYIIVPWQKTA